MRALIALAASLAVPACASAPVALAPAQIEIAGQTASLSGPFTRLPASPVYQGKRLTRLGHEVDLIWIIEGARPGQRLVEASADTADGPVLDALEGDLPSGFILETLKAAGYGHGDPSGPVQLSPLWSPGESFRLATPSGLSYVAEVRTREREGRLDLVIAVAVESPVASAIRADQSALLSSLQ